MSILQRCPFCRESIKGSKEKKGPTLGVHFTEVSILKRCLLSVILGLSGLSVTKSQGWGIFPGYCERGPDYLHRKIEPKQILSCLIPRLQFVSTWQLEILVFMQKFCQTHPPSTQPLYPYWDILKTLIKLWHSILFWALACDSPHVRPISSISFITILYQVVFGPCLFPLPVGVHLMGILSLGMLRT